MIKAPAVLEAERNIPIAELDSRLAALNLGSQLGGYRSSSRPDEAATLDSYQIALIRFQSGGLAAANASRDSSIRNVLLLPFTWKEFLTQVRSEFDHSGPTRESSIVQFGNISVDLFAMEVRQSGCLVNMTAMEFNLLKFFMLNPNRVITREDLLDQVWGYENYPTTRTVDNHVLRLRQKLEREAANPVHFRTVHGVGYKFVP